jgi:hypothetical protein
MKQEVENKVSAKGQPKAASNGPAGKRKEIAAVQTAGKQTA